MQKYKLFLIVLGLFCLGLITTSFMLMGGPVSQKGVTLDTRRLNDFQSIQTGIQTYYTNNGKLPDNLDEITILKDNMLDPESKTPYIYEVLSSISYNLCTTFSTDGTQIDSYLIRGYDNTTSGTIKKGYSCLTYKIPNFMITATPSPYIENFNGNPTPTLEIIID